MYILASRSVHILCPQAKLLALLPQPPHLPLVYSFPRWTLSFSPLGVNVAKIPSKNPFLTPPQPFLKSSWFVPTLYHRSLTLWDLSRYTIVAHLLFVSPLRFSYKLLESKDYILSAVIFLVGCSGLNKCLINIANERIIQFSDDTSHMFMRCIY